MGAVQAGSTDAQRGTPVVVLDLRPHPAQRIGDATHGSPAELVAAVEGAVEGLAGQHASVPKVGGRPSNFRVQVFPQLLLAPVSP